jgi:hypothetical protein
MSRLNTVPLMDWWFAGVLVSFYWTVKEVFNWEGETLEWASYFIAFLISLMYYLSIMRWKYSFNTVVKLILSVPFYILLLLDISPSIAHLIFLFASVILWLGKYYNDRHKGIELINIFFLLYYLLLFHIASKLVHWTTFDNFIWAKVPESSEYYKYANIIEQVVPPVVLAILFSSLIIMIFSLRSDFNWRPLKRFWWFIPVILFFMEAFSTSGFYLKEGGGAMYHWQVYVGVLEMMEQGGYLLWNTPSTYGFLSMITPYLIPFGDAWQKMYFVNGILRLAFGLLIFTVIWNKRGLLWYVISIGLTLAIVYYLPGSANLNNSAETPSGGAMRYFWIVLLMYIVVGIREKELKTQMLFITPIWLVGVFWSFESAFFVSAVLGPYVLYHLFFNPEKSFDHLKYLIIYPGLSFTFIVLLISLFYYFRLGHLPDYFMFIEFAFGNVGGYFSEIFTLNTPLWVHAIILSWLLSQVNDKKNIHVLFSIWFGLWAILSYSIGQSVGIGLLKLLPIYIFGLFLSFQLLENNKEKKVIYNFIPLFVIILTITFGNPKSIRHLYKTITNQDYSFENVAFNEINNFHEILTIIEPGQTPVVYVDETRYLNFLSKRQYKDVKTKKLISLSDQIWLPIHPASLIEGYPEERKIELINRWIDRHPAERGWIVNPIDNRYHRNYEVALEKVFSDTFRIKKRVEHGVLKATLYEKIN